MTSFKDLLKATTSFQTKHPYLVLFLIIAITLFMYGGYTQVQTVASLEQMMPSDIEEIDAFNTLRDARLGQDMVAIIVRVDRDSTDPTGHLDVRDYEVATYVNHLSTLIETEPDVLQTHSYADMIPTSEDGFPPRHVYEQTIETTLFKEQESQFINHDKSITLILAKTDVSADDNRMNSLSSKIKKNIESAGHPPGIKVQVTGTPIVQQRLGELINTDRSVTQNISTLFVFLIIILIFGTLTSALVPIVIVTVSVAWLYGTMGYTGLPISTLAGGVAAMVIGIGIDYSIHIMNRFKVQRKKGDSVAQAMQQSITTTGMALTGAAIATVIAFLAFTVGYMPEMARFGLLMAIGVSYAFILSLLGLPALLILEERAIHALTKKLRFGIEGEYRLYDRDEICPDDSQEVELDDTEIARLVKEKRIVKVPVRKTTSMKQATRKKPTTQAQRKQKNKGQGGRQ